MSDRQGRSFAMSHGQSNLRPPWQPGQSGNPAGRPPGSVGLVNYLKRLLQEPADDEPGKTKGEQIMDELARRARRGRSPKLIQILLDRVEGPVQQTIAHTVMPAVVVRVVNEKAHDEQTDEEPDDEDDRDEDEEGR